MGEILQENYEKLNESKEHYWQILYNGHVLGIFSDFEEMIKVYKMYKRNMVKDNIPLLSFDVVFKE